MIGLFRLIWRRDRDLNPRRATNPCRFSRPVLSTTQPSLRSGANNIDWGLSCKPLNAILFVKITKVLARSNYDGFYKGDFTINVVIIRIIHKNLALDQIVK